MSSTTRVKNCEDCKAQVTVAYRIRGLKNMSWYFVCKPCCDKSKKLPGYQYGGTWKGEKK